MTNAKATNRKAPAKRTAAKKTTSTKVDYEPNKMTFLVAALAAVSLAVLGLLAVYS